MLRTRLLYKFIWHSFFKREKSEEVHGAESVERHTKWIERRERERERERETGVMLTRKYIRFRCIYLNRTLGHKTNCMSAYKLEYDLKLGKCNKFSKVSHTLEEKSWSVST